MSILNFKGIINKYIGKVRDVYNYKNKYVILVTSNRISAFDIVFPFEITHKGNILNSLASYFLKNSKHIVDNWYLTSPLPNVSIGLYCEPIRIEMVVRAYLSGHLWRIYHSGKREICGVKLPNGLFENDILPYPIITPTTKSLDSHDQDISKEQILNQKIVPEELYFKMEENALKMFNFGQEEAHKRGLILVDTKYEFGLNKNKLFLIDEVHTPDSSRYFYLDSYNELQKNKQPQRHLSKEYFRQWLISKGFQGLERQKIPQFTQDDILKISNRYIELYELFTKNKINFTNNKISDIEFNKIVQNKINELENA